MDEKMMTKQMLIAHNRRIGCKCSFSLILIEKMEKRAVFKEMKLKMAEYHQVSQRKFVKAFWNELPENTAAELKKEGFKIGNLKDFKSKEKSLYLYRHISRYKAEKSMPDASFPEMNILKCHGHIFCEGYKIEYNDIRSVYNAKICAQSFLKK